MLPTHYASKAIPAKIKKTPGKLKNLTAPLNGLSLAVTGAEGDTQTAVVLKNFVVENDRVSVRAGYVKKATRGVQPVTNIIPYYGLPQAVAASSNHEIWNAQNGNLIQGGFISDDWDFASFSNLGDREYTVMVNGADGVWSWNGSLATGSNPAAFAVTNLSSSNPAVCTVAASNMPKLQNGMTVTIAGADTGHTAANGSHVIANVGKGDTATFELVGVDTSAGGAAQTTGVNVDPPGLAPMAKETITTDPADTFIAPNSFQLVLAHQNRLFFADGSNLAVYYLPLYVRSGQVSYLPLNGVFKRGGTIKAMAVWTIDGGENLNDQLCIFSTNGEVAIYAGTDPDTDFQLTGVFRFDAPMSKHAVVNYGGELWVLISTGLVPMSVMMRAETEKLGIEQKDIISEFLKRSTAYRADPGWQAYLNPSSGRLICNVPLGGPNAYKQVVRHMAKEVWMEWGEIKSRSWGWLDPYLYFGDDNGNVYEMHPIHRNDDGKMIRVDLMMAWSRFGTAANKQFKAVRSYLVTDGNVHPKIDVKTNFDMSLGVNVPDISDLSGASMWDVAHWDVDYWAPGERPIIKWNGVAAKGVYGAIRLTADINNCTFAVTGFDVMFEEGLFGAP
jgi:hypothetical protein